MRTIVQFSDLHFGRHSSDLAEGLVEFIAKHEADLIVVSGDFTQRARLSEFAAAKRFLSRLAPPKLLVAGNHDVPLYNLFHRYFRPFENYDRYITPLGQDADFFHDDEIAVLGVNTARRFTRKNGRLSIQQIANIERIFGSLPLEICKVLVTHHPLAIPNGAASLELAGRSSQALETISKAGVHLLLSGHHHVASSGPVTEVHGGGSVLIVHAGTAISTRTRGGESNSFNVLRLWPNKTEISVLAWEDGSGFRKEKVTCYGLHGGRWEVERNQHG